MTNIPIFEEQDFIDLPDYSHLFSEFIQNKEYNDLLLYFDTHQSVSPESLQQFLHKEDAPWVLPNDGMTEEEYAEQLNELESRARRLSVGMHEIMTLYNGMINASKHHIEEILQVHAVEQLADLPPTDNFY